jgi:hypothetical protein
VPRARRSTHVWRSSPSSRTIRTGVLYRAGYRPAVLV